MWKAVLVLLMTSSPQPAQPTDSEPLSMMVGEFPDAFKSQNDCQKFLTGSQNEIDRQVEVYTEQGKAQNYSVLHHEVSCVVDETGDPV
jgi:hypothetical protein